MTADENLFPVWGLYAENAFGYNGLRAMASLEEKEGPQWFTPVSYTPHDCHKH